MPVASRRAFLGRALRAGAASSAASLLPAPWAWAAPPSEPEDASPLARFPDLKRHFVFEYYPWYGGPPAYEHWDYLDRKPPYDIASALRAPPRTLRRAPRSPCSSSTHAGSTKPGWAPSPSPGGAATASRISPLRAIMDVMSDHDIKVTFALEPYADDRGQRFADDILYLIARVRREARFRRFPDPPERGWQRRGRSSRASAASCPSRPPTAAGRYQPDPGLHPGRGLARADRSSSRRPCAATSTTSPCSPTRWSSPGPRPRASTASASTTTSSGPSATGPRGRGVARRAALLLQREPGLRPDRAPLPLPTARALPIRPIPATCRDPPPPPATSWTGPRAEEREKAASASAARIASRSRRPSRSRRTRP